MRSFSILLPVPDPLVIKQNCQLIFNNHSRHWDKGHQRAVSLLFWWAGCRASWCAVALILFFSISEQGQGHMYCLGGGGKTLTVQEVDHQLVGAHHDGGVGDLSYQVGGEATVQGAVTLLFGHCS